MLALPTLGHRAPHWVNLGTRKLSDLSPEARQQVAPLLEDMTKFAIATIFSVALIVASCGGGTSAPPAPTDQISLTLSAATVTAPQDGTPISVDVTVTRTGGNGSPVTLSVLSLPTGILAQVESPGTGNSGRVTFTVQGATAGS